MPLPVNAALTITVKMAAVSAYVQQKAKLSPQCFERIFHALNYEIPG